jgi:hypothetical protein
MFNGSESNKKLFFQPQKNNRKRITKVDQRPYTVRLSVRTQPLKKHIPNGISLIEILLCLALLGFTIVPVTVLIQSVGNTNKVFFSQKVKTTVLNSILRNIDPENIDFYNSYNKTTMQTVTVNGLTVPYITKVDDSNSNALKHRLYVYLYNSVNDSLTSPLFEYSNDYYLDELHIDCGESTLGLVDSSDQLWSPDIQYDPTTNKTHAGWYTAGSGAASTAATISNVSTTNNPIYTSYRAAGSTSGNTFEYRFDVDNGNYVVQLYFAELSGSTTRTLDVSVEGVVPSIPNMTNFNAYATANNTNQRAVIRTIPVTVYDGTLNLVVTTKTTGQAARLQGLVLRRVL